MVASPPQNLLGIGLYTPAEAARYARISTQMMSRWLFGNQTGDPVVHPQLRPHDGNRSVTFLDFVQAMAIRAIRQEYRIPLQRIRDAVAHARDKYSIEYPFAAPHKTFLFDSSIIINIGEESEPDLVEMSGKTRDQRVLREVAELYMDDLHYENNLATRFDIFEHGGQTIVMDPEIRFGQPMLPCGYTAEALAGAYFTEGSIAAAAEAMGVSEADVKLALRFDDYLQPSLRDAAAA